jgi:His-Xaa-Ser system radical SAM maturase HxsB
VIQKDYHLLPFNFDRFNNKEILVNLFGDFLIVDQGTANKIVNRTIVNPELIKTLISNHFISPSSYPKDMEVLATRYRTKKAFLEEFTALHIIVITLNCNQACTYCQVSSKNTGKKNYDISWKNLKKSIEMIFESPSASITIEFQGGEPTLAFDKIKYAIEYSKALNKEFSKKISFVICSNSIELTPSVLQFMKIHNVLLSTSLDGPEYIHNKNRISRNHDSYERTIEGIEKARTILGEENVSALMTTTIHSIPHPKQIIDEYRQQGFRNIFFREINPYGYAVNNHIADYSTNEFIQFYKQGFDYILELNRSGETFIEDFASIILRKILTPYTAGFVDLQSPAGIINSVLVYNYNGYVYVSDEARMMAEQANNFFRIGHVNDGLKKIISSSKVAQIARHWSNESLAGCSDCAYNVYCGADPVRNYLKTGDMEGYRPDSEFCHKNKIIIKYLIGKSLDPENYRIFQKWLSN